MSPKRILIVDDNELNREILYHHLSAAGYNAVTADSGLEAIRLADEKRVDLMLLDVMMPEMDGFETLHRIREKHPLSELPVIMITALSQSKDIIKALSMGANDYIAKPIDTAVALARIRTQLHLLESEQALRESQERYALASEGANDGLWDWNLKTQEIYLSPRWKAMMGFSDEHVCDADASWFERIHPDDRARVQSDLRRHLEGECENFASEYRILHAEGTYIWVFCRGLAVRDAQGTPYRMAGSQTDITNHGMHDALTGLPKRSLFLHSLTRAVNHQGKFDAHYAVLYLDLDRFKMINDNFGHQVGDDVLIEVGRRLDACIDARDTLARLEGDDFAILHREMPELDDALALAHKIQAHIAEPQHVNGRDIAMEVSIGIAYGGSHGDDAEVLLRNAHIALFHAKKMGSGSINIYDAEMHQEAVRRLRLESNLRKAVRNCDFSLCFQPQVELKTRELTGLEALIRWTDPELGVVPPSDFIPAAEELGLIGSIGDWVLEQVISEAKRWQAEGLDPIRVAINISPKQFSQFDMVDRLSHVLSKHAFEPKYLEIEITESVLMDHSDLAVETLNAIHRMGCRISIDDFGTGYSSLGYLKRFPIDCIKIDRSFVREINVNPDDAAITSAIVAIAHNLKMCVIAEGVEHEDHVQHLLDIGCEEAQGNYFASPLTAIETRRFLANLKQQSTNNMRVVG
ncbi:MAG: EAL domain-containing protein [Acidobacteria bacterium]|nr:EAL domain-containing protein [Acidobacteriota bacterium]